MTAQPLRIFVAMPGSTMGEYSKWTDIEEIKENLLQPVAEQIGEKLGRATELVIEKDKPEGIPIFDSMYGEAIHSDVYISDLSGANPNVYLELGVRWALRDGVTIVIVQDKRDILFNASAVRYFLYGQGPTVLKKAINQIVGAAVIGLEKPQQIDSLVRKGLSMVQVPRDELQALRDEISQLKEAQADDLVAAARKSSSPAEAIGLLRQAIVRNPVNPQARYELGVALRKAADYPEAVAELREAVKLKEDWAEAWRELGVALNKNGQLAEADQAFRSAVALNSDDAETWSTLGGLRRRLARSSAGSFNWAMLRESREAYHHASQIRPNDTYSLVNEARVNLLLSAEEPSTRPAVMSRLRTLEKLAQFEVESDDPEADPEAEPWWKRFDLADTLLLTGRVDEGLTVLRSAIELVKPPQRESSLTTYIAPLRDFLAVGVLDESAADGAREAIDICEKAIEAARQARSPAPPAS